jgi:hypothetical protein
MDHQPAATRPLAFHPLAVAGQREYSAVVITPTGDRHERQLFAANRAAAEQALETEFPEPRYLRVREA